MSELSALGAVVDPAPSPASGLKKEKLGVLAVAFFVIAAAAPIAAVVVVAPAIFMLVGPAAPLIYVAVALVVALFAVGYLRMSRYIANAGGFVTFIDAGLGRTWAAGGAGLAIVTYLGLQVGVWAQVGVFVEDLVLQLTGMDLPPVIWVSVLVVLIGVLVARGIDASVSILAVLIAAETVVVGVLILAVVARNGFKVFTLEGFTADRIFGPGLGVALLLGFLCFTAFEATTVFSEEARNPHRTIPRALYLVIAFVGVFYTLSTWVVSGAVGIDAVQSVAGADPTGFIFTVATQNGGEVLGMAMKILVVTSELALMLGLANMFSRYLFALGRAGLLPASLAAVNRKGSPARASTVNSIIVGVLAVAFLIAGADPITVIFAWFTGLGTVAFVAILLLTSIAVIAFFARNAFPINAWASYIAPTLSAVIFVCIGYLTLTNYDLLGGPSLGAKFLLVIIPIVFATCVIRVRTKQSINFSSQAI